MNRNILSSSTTVTRRDVLAAGAVLAFGWAGSDRAAPAAEEIIDIHAHIISPDTQRYPPAPLGGKASEWTKERPVTFEEYVVQANDAGVSKVVFVQPSTYYGVDNSYLVDSIAKDPKRCTGVCSINTIGPDAVQALGRVMRQGVTGLRIFTNGLETDLLIDPRAIPVWEDAVKEGFTICTSIQAPVFPQLRTLVQRYPQVRVVLDHGTLIKVDDGPPYSQAQSFFEMAQFPNFYIKITSATFAHARTGKARPETFFPKLVSVFGADHIAFGSDLPSSTGSLGHAVAEAKACLSTLSATDRAMVLAGTAKRLYPVLA